MQAIELRVACKQRRGVFSDQPTDIRFRQLRSESREQGERQGRIDIRWKPNDLLVKRIE